ncbi:MAG: hypothetical protein CW691_02600 [Candidatus Bathyarchaeum sp.]|nr:MAG: hypothetical protein CW691_02600 [Candidatus Bathyarchaeum sp.]
MNKPNEKGHLFSKVKIIVLLPLTIFLWMIGWTLYWVGDQGMSSGNVQQTPIDSEENSAPASLDVHQTTPFQKH